MTSDENKSSIEDDFIEQVALDYRNSVNTDEIKRIIESGMDSLKERVQEYSYSEWSPEERIAYSLMISRAKFDEDNPIPSFLLSAEPVIRTGITFIQEQDDYWRFKPCIELVFELDDNEIRQAMDFFEDFEQSDFGVASQQYYNSIFDKIHDIEKTKKDEKKKVFNEIINNNLEIPEEPRDDYVLAGIVDKYLEVYQELAEFFEIAFPKLLALKRILDGEEVDLEVLQSKNGSSVYRELTDSTQENSVYFDLIAEQYDSRLRNGLAHGDYLVNDTQKKVQIPTEDIQYSFEEIENLVNKNISNFIFLTGTLQSLIQWRYYTYDLDENTREILPI